MAKTFSAIFLPHISQDSLFANFFTFLAKLENNAIESKLGRIRPHLFQFRFFEFKKLNSNLNLVEFDQCH